MSELKAHTVAQVIEQLEACNFECEAGPLTHNIAWQWFKTAAQGGPEFWPGQRVWFEVEAEASGVKLRQHAAFFIVGCRMESDTEKRFWSYSLSYDPPGPWHYGETHFSGIKGDKLSIGCPTRTGAPS